MGGCAIEQQINRAARARTHERRHETHLPAHTRADVSRLRTRLETALCFHITVFTTLAAREGTLAYCQLIAAKDYGARMTAGRHQTQNSK